MCVLTGSLPPFRLSNGTFGLLEMYYNGTWGTICDDSFDANSNGCTVVCRALGYT